MPFAVAAGAIGLVGTMISSDAAEDAQNNATAAQSSTAAGQLALGKDQLQWNKDQFYAQKPMADAIAQKQLDVADQQIATQKAQNTIAAGYDEYNTSTFRPLEKQIVADAQSYDTPERRAAAVASATADTTHAFTDATKNMQASLGRAGIAPGSGRSAALMNDTAIAQAQATTGATQQATNNIDTIGHARMMDAASLGRGLPSAQSTTAATGIQAGSAATAAGTAAINAAASGIPAVNQAYSGAIAAGNSAGNLYGQAANSYGAIANAGAGALGAFGKAVGAGGYGNPLSYFTNPNAAGSINSGGFGTGAGYGNLDMGEFLSSKKAKVNTSKPMDSKAALAAVNDTPVKADWSYKPGMADGGARPHDGAMAEDLNKTMGENVAPGGNVVDMASYIAKLHAATQELSAKVDALGAKKKRKAA